MKDSKKLRGTPLPTELALCLKTGKIFIDVNTEPEVKISEWSAKVAPSSKKDRKHPNG